MGRLSSEWGFLPTRRSLFSNFKVGFDPIKRPSSATNSGVRAELWMLYGRSQRQPKPPFKSILNGAFSEIGAANLTNRKVADIMGWSPEQVDQIRKRYVDASAIVVDLTRLRGGGL